jgi:hypothetical protein
MLPTFEIATSDSIGHVFEDIGIEAYKEKRYLYPI